MTRLADHPLVQLTLVRVREFTREPEAVFWSLLFPVLITAVSYTHLRAHETVLALVCRLLLVKKNETTNYQHLYVI